MKKRGFTLIELIVVVTIMAVLTAIGVISYAGVTKKSRDSRRTADLEKVRVALEMARQVGSTYPADLSTLVTMNLMGGTMTDPKAGFSYSYVRSSNYVYSLYAQMEDPSSANLNPAIRGCGASCNYVVTNP